MAFSKDRSKWWRGFLGTAPDKDRAVPEILRQRYVEEMHYPQFREKLLHIATDKSKHAEGFAEQIVTLGGKLPEVAEHRATDDSSCQYLRTDLAEESRCADCLPVQIWRIESDHPDMSEFLKQIFEAEKIHRQEINDMLMRSDGFTRSLA
jgi:bacterioferritin (cytochrome b1)